MQFLFIGGQLDDQWLDVASHRHVAPDRWTHHWSVSVEVQNDVSAPEPEVRVFMQEYKRALFALPQVERFMGEPNMMYEYIYVLDEKGMSIDQTKAAEIAGKLAAGPPNS